MMDQGAGRYGPGEREKGITIKSHAIQINYKHTDGQEYILNLIDTPGTLTLVMK